MPLTVGTIASQLGGELLGAGDICIARIASLEGADPQSISFISGERYRPQLQATRAACVIMAPAMAQWDCGASSRILVGDPYLAYARLTQWWKQSLTPPVVPGIHASAVVDASARLASTAAVGALSHVAAGAVIGERVTIGPRCSVGQGAVIGDDTQLVSGVSIGAGCRIGRRGLLHPGVVIGADGFGFAPAQGLWEKIEQLGSVRIGDDVEIGANSCIDRGALDDTVVEDGVKIDNLVQIGHNVHIGAHTAIAGCVGVAGSARIGAHCMIGGAAMILGHLEIAPGCQITAGTLVSRSIRQKGTYSGAFPFDDNAAWEKNAATLRQLHQMRERLRALERKLS